MKSISFLCIILVIISYANTSVEQSVVRVESKVLNYDYKQVWEKPSYKTITGSAVLIKTNTF